MEFQWQDKSDCGWRIGFTQSNFLLAEGSGASLNFGKLLFRHLQNEGSELRRELFDLDNFIQKRRDEMVNSQPAKVEKAQHAGQ